MKTRPRQGQRENKKPHTRREQKQHNRGGTRRKATQEDEDNTMMKRNTATRARPIEGQLPKDYTRHKTHNDTDYDKGKGKDTRHT